MSLKRIMVHYDATPRGERALAAALSLADRQDAHLIGCATREEPRIPTYAAAQIPADVIDSLVEEQRKLVRSAHESFENAARAAGREDRCEFIEAGGDPARVLTSFGRGCDLLVVGQSEPDMEAVDIEELPDNLVMESGRPVLIVPYIGQRATIGEHVLLCWTNTREAARAMSDALPLMGKASKVTVLTIEDKDADMDGLLGDDAARYLAAHGISAELRRAVQPNVDAGTAILNEAAEQGADLIVMGAYGHSRLRETILGGATRTILKSMTAPVLMSH